VVAKPPCCGSNFVKRALEFKRVTFCSEDKKILKLLLRTRGNLESVKKFVLDFLERKRAQCEEKKRSRKSVECKASQGESELKDCHSATRSCSSACTDTTCYCCAGLVHNSKATEEVAWGNKNKFSNINNDNNNNNWCVNNNDNFDTESMDCGQGAVRDEVDEDILKLVEKDWMEFVSVVLASASGDKHHTKPYNYSYNYSFNYSSISHKSNEVLDLNDLDPWLQAWLSSPSPSSQSSCSTPTTDSIEVLEVVWSA